ALSAAAQDRKARLAQLKSLKRKQPDTQDALEDESATVPSVQESAVDEQQQTQEDELQDASVKYLSGRNYDSATRGPKLGFEVMPSEGRETLEVRAEALAQETKRQAEEEAKADQPLDLFKLQPKKPNWDLKRDLDRKMEVLNVRTDNAIARLVRERIAGQQARAVHANGTRQGEDTDGEAAGVEGTTLVEGTREREREAEEDARREMQEEQALLDGS
ncbi:hypothetical protein K431DRAFT_195963, partial [Polychaeton citri CBS 116435]